MPISHNNLNLWNTNIMADYNQHNYPSGNIKYNI